MKGDPGVRRSRFDRPGIGVVVLTLPFAFAVITAPLVRSPLGFILSLLGVLSLVLAAWPAVRPGGAVDLGNPMFLTSILVGLGVTIKLSWLAVVGLDAPLGVFLRVAEDPGLLVWGALASLVGLGAVSFGFALPVGGSRSIQTSGSLRSGMWPRRGLGWMIVLTALVATFGLVMFARSIDVSGLAATSLDQLSAKRFNDLSGGASSRLGSATYLWFRVASLGHVPFLLSLVAVVRRWLPRSLATGALMGTFVLAAAAPVLADNRAGVALLLLDGALVRYYLGGGFQFRSAMRSIAGGLIAIIGMLSVRTGGAGRAGLSIFEQAFLGRDLMDVSKLAQVVAMPEVAPLGGQTLYGWLLAPFPEAWFASKPLWSGLGQYVWQEAYGSGGINGVHPGLFGELYLNFWWPGLVVGGLLFGMVLRWIYLSFRPVVHNPAGAIVYVTVIVHLVFFGLSNDLGTGILSALLDALPLVVVAWILGRSPVRPIGPRFSETEGRPLAGSSRRRD